MAIYHFHARPLRRKNGESALFNVAYTTGSALLHRAICTVYDFSRRRDVLDTGLVFPGNAAVNESPESFWNRSEDHQRHKRAVTGREIEMSIPKELSPEGRLRLIREYAIDVSNRYGVAVQFALHAPKQSSRKPGDLDDGANADGNCNFHLHCTLSSCSVSETGELGKKVVELDPIASQRGSGAPNFIWAERKHWQDAVNRALAAEGLSERVDCRSYADQGIDRLPGIHLGATAAAIERTGRKSRRRMWAEQSQALRKCQGAANDPWDQFDDLVGSTENFGYGETGEGSHALELALGLRESDVASTRGSAASAEIAPEVFFDAPQPLGDDGDPEPEQVAVPAQEPEPEADPRPVPAPTPPLAPSSPRPALHRPQPADLKEQEAKRRREMDRLAALFGPEFDEPPKQPRRRELRESTGYCPPGLEVEPGIQATFKVENQGPPDSHAGLAPPGRKPRPRL